MGAGVSHKLAMMEAAVTKKLIIWIGALALLLGCSAGQAFITPSPAPPPATTSAPQPAGPYDVPGTLTALPRTGPCEVMIFSTYATVVQNPQTGEGRLGTADLGAVYPVLGQFQSEFGMWYQISYAGQTGWVPAHYGEGDALVAEPQGDCSQVPVIQPPAQP